MKDAVVPIIIAIIAGLFSGGAIPLFQAVTGRGKARVDAVRALGEASAEWVERFEVKAGAALDEAERARTELRLVRSEAHALAGELHRLRSLIFQDPPMPLDQLRAAARNGGSYP